MSKLKAALLSLGARGTISKAITYVKRRGQNIAEKKPEIIDVKSPAQLSWRHMYTKCANLWSTLSALEQQQWESLARPLHMTGFAYWQSQCLRPNPGIYLPLQGGTMSGDIDMAKNRLLKLPAPTDAQEADTLTARTAAITTHTADLDAHTKNLAETMRTGEYLYPIPAGRIESKVMVPDFLYLMLFFVARPITVDRIAIQVTGASGAGTRARLGIYNDGVNLYPGTLLLDAGTVLTDAGGIKSIVINQALQKGIYWLCVLCQSNPTIYSYLFHYAPAWFWHLDLGSPNAGWAVAQAYNGLPDPYPAAADQLATLAFVTCRLASLD